MISVRQQQVKNISLNFGLVFFRYFFSNIIFLLAIFIGDIILFFKVFKLCIIVNCLGHVIGKLYWF